MLENIEILCHSSIKIARDKTIYFDPFKIEKNYKDADIIFITHNHYDHYSEEDINKIKKENTVIIAPKDLFNTLLNFGFNSNSILCVEPNKQYEFAGITFETVSAYNINKAFHPKENNWVGYIIELDSVRYYIAGDTDINEENKKVKCDVAFLPVGGTYTTTAKEAATLANKISPKIAIPTHYGEVVGSNQDAIDFLNSLNPNIQGKILMK